MNFALKEFLEGPVTLIPPVDADNKAMILTTKQRFLFFFDAETRKKGHLAGLWWESEYLSSERMIVSKRNLE